jgi:uncharacterized protein with PIN domain
MPRTIKFHVDEHVDPAIATGLRRGGVDVSLTSDAGLAGAKDESQLRSCTSSGRVMLTMDQDFLRRHHSDPGHPGIVFAHQFRSSIGDLIRGLVLIWELLESADMAGRIGYL